MSSQNIVKSLVSEEKEPQKQRFVKICDRQDCCNIPQSAWRPLTDNYLLQTWKGIHLDKSPIELSLYPMLIYELQPQTIIELGSLTGGSAVWLADHLDLFGIKGQVYSVDIDLSQLNHKAKVDRRIKFLEGDINDVSVVLTPDLLSTLPHPWLIIEDAHVNLIGVLDYFHHHDLQSEDYLIIEDTNKDLWEAWSDWDDREFIAKMGDKLNKLKTWLMNHQQEYMIDSYYQDMYGYNGSKNWNSILKKI